jgi:DNA-binding NarL/FixJ family response regulator
LARFHVVIVSRHSLFAEGVASSLRQQLSEGEIQTIDARAPGCLERLIAAQPSTVILDATDQELEALCPLTKLLNALPSLQVIRLDPQQEQIQVVSSEQRAVAGVHELVKVLKSPPAGA